MRIRKRAEEKQRKLLATSHSMEGEVLIYFILFYKFAIYKNTFCGFSGNCPCIGNTANETLQISIISVFFAMSSKFEKYRTNSINRVCLEKLIVVHLLKEILRLVWNT
jgi:hypothetical protein